MNTCDTCRHWGPGDGYHCRKPYGYCMRPMWKGWGDKIPLDDCEQPERGACGHGDPGSPGLLRTGPKFGCLKHQSGKYVKPLTDEEYVNETPKGRLLREIFEEEDAKVFEALDKECGPKKMDDGFRNPHKRTHRG